MKWPNGAECPHCQAKEPYYLKTQKRWKCRKCRKQFSVKVGTIFEDSPIPLQKWMPAVWLLTGCKNGVSSWEIHRALGVTQKTAWFMMHRIRLALRDSNKGPVGGVENEVEVDETYIGGKLKNMHPAKAARYRAQSSTAMLAGVTGKTPVIGLLNRTAREIRTQVVPDVSRLALQNVVLQTVEYGTNVYTDQAPAYKNLHKTYVHQIVNHAETYVNGRVHTNGLENFWSLFKRHIHGTYVCVEPFHLERYLDEQVYRYNNRGTREKPMDDYARFEKALSQVANKRLTYAELTGKSGDARTTTPEPF
jgi:transposase-like protein